MYFKKKNAGIMRWYIIKIKIENKQSFFGKKVGCAHLFDRSISIIHYKTRGKLKLGK